MAASPTLFERYPLLTFYGLVALLSWGVIAPLVLLTGQPLLVGLIAFVPTPAAYLTEALVGWRRRTPGRRSPSEVGRRTGLWRIAPRWYFAALAIPWLAHAMAAFAAQQLDAELAFPAEQFLSLGLFTLVLAAAEEIGWRGFAIPHLLKLFSPLKAALLFGVLHAAFHLPMYLLPLPPDFRQASPFWLFTILAIGYSLPGMWLFNRTRGSVPVATVYHWSINMTVLLISGAPREMIGWLLPVVWAAAGISLLLLVGPGLHHARYLEDTQKESEEAQRAEEARLMR